MTSADYCAVVSKPSWSPAFLFGRTGFFHLIESLSNADDRFWRRTDANVWPRRRRFALASFYSPAKGSSNVLKTDNDKPHQSEGTPSDTPAVLFPVMLVALAFRRRNMQKKSKCIFNSVSAATNELQKPNGSYSECVCQCCIAVLCFALVLLP